MSKLDTCTFATLVLIISSGCGDKADPSKKFETLDLSVCDPATGSFTLDIDNEFFPLSVGSHWLLEGEDDGVLVRVEIDVLDEVEEVAGVDTRVVTESEYEDDELIEVSRNFFVQASDGTVCYYGEDVDDYEDGEVVGHAGEWRAGESGNLPGILMPGNPKIETKFAQEEAPGIAEDMSSIVSVDDAITVPAGTFEGCVHAVDWNPLEGDSFNDGEDKYYARGVGLLVDDVIELKSYTTP